MSDATPPTLARVLEVAREVVWLAKAYAALGYTAATGESRSMRDAARGAQHEAAHAKNAHARTAAPLLAAAAIAVGPALEEWRAARKALRESRVRLHALAGVARCSATSADAYEAECRAYQTGLTNADRADSALLAACDRADADATGRAAGGKGT